MHEHKQFLKEKHAIDDLLTGSSRIVHVEENLNGAFISFKTMDRDEVTTIRLLTPNARKYFTNRLFLGTTDKSAMR